MSNKTYSLYANDDSYQPKESDRLVIETGENHIALVVKDRTGIIKAFEWFKKESEEEKEFDTFFTNVVSSTDLFIKKYLSYDLFINNTKQVLIPGPLFNAENFNDTLDVVLGDAVDQVPAFDEIDGQDRVVNAYRYHPEAVDYLKSKYDFRHTRHTYTALLSKWMQANHSTPFVMEVMFYHDVFIVAVFVEGKLHIMKSFEWQAAEDVIYFLLSLSRSFGASTDDVFILVSGFIQPGSDVYQQLTKYFKNVSLETQLVGNNQLKSDEYPPHYFTPIYNLAI